MKDAAFKIIVLTIITLALLAILAIAKAQTLPTPTWNQALIPWDAPACSTDPTELTYCTLTEYRVYELQPNSTWKQVQSLTGDKTYWLATGLTVGSHTWHVTALNNGGKESLPSNSGAKTVSSPLPKAAPVAPAIKPVQ